MIKKREKRRRIFYVPGMISLIFIPLFCFYHFYKIDAFKVEKSMNIYIPLDSIVEKQLSQHTRVYKEFSFNNSEITESKKLHNLQYVLRKLYRENDTINGVKIHLGNKMNYEVYIRILDILTIEKIYTYVQYKNDFFVLIFPKRKPNKNLPKLILFECGYAEANKMYFLEQEKERQFQYNLALYKKYGFLFLGYFGILLLNIFALVKFNKNQNYNQK